MKSKQSRAALIRMIESGIRDYPNFPSDKLYVLVRDVEVIGSPPRRIDADLVVHFLPAGAPFCCGTPSCYSNVLAIDGQEELGDYLRRKMNLRSPVEITLDMTVRYFDGIEFTAFKKQGD